MRRHDFDAGFLGGLDLRLDGPRIDAGDQIDDLVLITDREFHALDPLAGLALVFPFLDFQAD